LITNKLNRLFILFILLFTSGISQNSDNTDWEKFGKYGESILNSATRFNNNDLVNYGIVAASTALAYQIDEKTKFFFRDEMPPFPKPLSVINEYSIAGLFAVAGGLYIHGRLADNEKNRELGLRLGSALIYSEAITGLLKVIIGRERPTISDDNSNFHFFRTSWDNTSFPSGHATAWMAFASVMALSTDNDFERGVYWTLAGVMTLERIYNRHHWLSDVVFGGAIGYFTGNLIGSKEKGEGAPPVFVPMINLTIGL